MILSITTPAHQQLYQQIENFQLDDPSSPLPFSLRLARDQGWTPAYTQRVITEYKRFLTLCCISHSPVTPPEAIDEAWHLHLTYTRSYWIALCRETLGRDIHHDPTRGGKEEGEKFGSWYQKTLSLYQQTFGSAPPPDIWPPDHLQPGPKRKKKRMSRHRPLLVPLTVLFASLFISAWGVPGVILIGMLVALVVYGLQRASGGDKRRTDGSNGSEGSLAGGCSTGHGHSDDGGDSGGDAGDSGCGSGCGGGCGGGD